MKNSILNSSPLLIHMRHGFSLVEMVIVVVVLGILVGLSFPAVLRYSQKADLQQEQNRMLEIRNGLNAYLADKNTLPNVSSWAADLAGGYTNLSQGQILKDVWGRDRVLRMYTDNTRNVQGSPVPVNYLSLHSMGPDGIATLVSGVAVINGAYSPDTGWWNDAGLPAATIVSGFSNLVVGGDDLMMKTTDYTSKLGSYELTVQRVDRISDALASYARSKYSAMVATCASLPVDVNGNTGDARCDTPGALELINYFPRSHAASQLETSPSSNWNYLDPTVIVNNSHTVTQRRAQMQNLMKLLGLPIENCCSSLELGSDGQPAPFYYFSNPRPRALSAKGCLARPTGNQQKLTPRVVTKNIPDNENDSTCG